MSRKRSIASRSDPLIAEAIRGFETCDTTTFPGGFPAWISRHPKALIHFLRTELTRHSQLKGKDLLTEKELNPYGLSNWMTDFEHGMVILTASVLELRWPIALRKAGLVDLIVDFMLGDVSFTYRIFRPAFWGRILWPLAELLRSFGQSVAADNVATETLALRAIARMCTLIDETPRKFLMDQSSNSMLAKSFCLIDSHSHFETSEFYNAPVLVRVRLYGRFLAVDPIVMIKWMTTTADRFSPLASEEVETFFRQLGPNGKEDVTSSIIKCMDYMKNDRGQFQELVLFSIAWVFSHGDAAVCDAFWTRLASPLAAAYWGQLEIMPIPEVLYENGLLFSHYGSSFLNSWTVDTCEKACRVFALSDFIPLTVRVMYVGIRYGNPGGRETAQCRLFLNKFSEFIEHCTSESATTAKKLQGILRPVVEPIFISTLDKFRLAPKDSDSEDTPTTPEPVKANLGEEPPKVNNGTDEPKSQPIPYSKGQSEVQCWIRFGKAIGLNEDEARQQRWDKLLKERGGLFGCSWKKCLLFDLDSDWPMLLCSDCFQAQYCANGDCQKRDWHEGTHKADCAKKSKTK